MHAKYGYRLCFDKKQRSHHKNGEAPTVGALTTANLTKSTLSMASQTGNPVLFEVIKAGLIFGHREKNSRENNSKLKKNLKLKKITQNFGNF